MADLTYEKYLEAVKVFETHDCTSGWMTTEELIAFANAASKWPNLSDFETAVKKLGWNYQCKTS